MKKSFTLGEIIIAVVIVLILATLGLAGYRQVIDNARQRVCESNLKALEAAVEIYSLENERFPATLGDLKLEHLQKGYARVIKDNDWWTKISYLLVKLSSSREAYAQMLTPDNLSRYGVDAQIFNCPADTNGAPSYGINASLEGKQWSEISDDTVIIADCDSYTWRNTSNFAHRHKKFWKKRFANFTRKNRKIDKIEMCDDDHCDGDDN